MVDGEKVMLVAEKCYILVYILSWREWGCRGHECSEYVS